jgi:ABC-type amino acid transport system permease subunit
VNQREIRPFELYLFIAVVYWVITYGMSRLSRTLESTMRPERRGRERVRARAAVSG